MPFKHVYFTGIVRDKLGRKMSKSLGNSPDPLDLIERFGADGVRMGMMLAAPAGNDILFDESLCEQGRNFCNKIWNCFRLIKGWIVKDADTDQGNRLAVQWFDAKLRETSLEVDDLMNKYRLSEALMAIYKLYTEDFSGWYLEMIKPSYGEPIDRGTYEHTLYFFDHMLRLLHPFMPFITEELWLDLGEGREAKGESIMVAPLLQAEVKTEDRALLSRIDHLREIVSGIRNIRAQKNIGLKELGQLFIVGATVEQPEGYYNLLKKLANLSEVCCNDKPQGSVSFLVETTEYAVPLSQFINVGEELKKLQADLQHQEGFLRGVMAKLSNERFVQNAKPEVVELERKKQHDAEQRIATIKEAIIALQH